MNDERLLFKCTIPGRPAVKKNQQKVVRRWGQTRVVYTPQFYEWEQRALLEMKRAMLGMDTIREPLEMKIHFTLENGRSLPDLSNLLEAPQDALTKAGVIEDDRLIQVINATRVHGNKKKPLEPKTEIELYALER